MRQAYRRRVCAVLSDNLNNADAAGAGALSRRGVLMGASAAVAAGVPAAVVASSPAGASLDAGLIDMCEAFDVLQRAYLASFSVELFSPAQELARDVANRPIFARQADLLQRIFEARAVTPAGHAARARTAMLLDPDLLNPSTMNGWNAVIGAAIIRDLAAPVAAGEVV